MCVFPMQYKKCVAYFTPVEQLTGRVGERESGRAGEWESRRVGDESNSPSQFLPFPHSIGT
jgi:hypothetical protein